jgi:anti-sigma factor RsiW
MRKVLYRFDCPTPHQLGEFHLGVAAPPDAERVSQHVAGCPLCQADLGTLRGFMEAQAIRPLAKAEPEAPPSVFGWVQEVVAKLLPATPATALRGSLSPQIIAAADGVTIILTPQTAADGSLSVSGQIAADDQDRWTEAVVQLRRADDLLATALVDDLGGFRCEGLSSGEAQLRITPQTGPAVRVPEIELKA